MTDYKERFRERFVVGDRIRAVATPEEVLAFVEEELMREGANAWEGGRKAGRAEERKNLIGVVEGVELLPISHERWCDYETAEEKEFARCNCNQSELFWLQKEVRDILKILSDSSEGEEFTWNGGKFDILETPDKDGNYPESGIQEDGFKVADENLKNGEVGPYKEHPVQEETECCEKLARQFHDTYERLAPQFGYETRSDTRDFDPKSPNGRLMKAVIAELFCHKPRTEVSQGACIYCHDPRPHGH